MKFVSIISLLLYININAQAPPTQPLMGPGGSDYTHGGVIPQACLPETDTGYLNQTNLNRIQQTLLYLTMVGGFIILGLMDSGLSTLLEREIL